MTNSIASTDPKFAREFLAENPVCVACGRTERLTIDHIIPQSKGGTDDKENLRTLCIYCNSSKRDKDNEHWMRYWAPRPKVSILQALQNARA